MRGEIARLAPRLGLNLAEELYRERPDRHAPFDEARLSGPAIVAGDFNTWSEERTDALFVAMERARFSSPYPRSASTAPPDGRTRSGDHYLDHAFVRGLDVTDATVLTTIESSDHQALSFAVRVPPEKRFTLDARGSLSSSR